MHFVYLFCLVLAALFLDTQIWAETDPYLVDDVRVVPADLQAAYPDKSINEFTRADLIDFVTKRAFNALLQKLTSQDTWSQHVWLKASVRPQDVLETINVVSEVTEPAYEMIVDVQFNPQKVRAALRRFNIPFSEVSSVRILLLPMFVSDDDYVLWHEFNPWRTALQANMQAHRTVSIIFPTGDMSDIRLLEPRMAVFGAQDVLEAMRKKYAADYLLVAQLRPSANEQLDVRMRWFGAEDMPFTNQALTIEPLQEQDNYALAAQRVLQNVVNQWQQSGLIGANDAQSVTYRLRVGKPQLLSAFQDVMQQMKQVSRVQPQIISRGEGVYRVEFFGDLIQINQQLTKAGYTIERDNQRWLVTPTE